MFVDEVLKGLHYTREKYRDKPIATGETNVFMLCDDCITAIEELQFWAGNLSEVQRHIEDQIANDWEDWVEIRQKSVAMVGLSEEVGEVAGLVKRDFRRFDGDAERIPREKFVEELGDVLWYLTALATVYDITLDEIWNYNLKKLEERYGDHTIQGRRD